MHVSYEPVRGFRDYIPPESEFLTWICQTFAEVVKRFGYIEIRTPTIESFQLFALKSGEEIRESMFVFKDKAGREVALRPEITPSIVRVYLKELRHWSKPIRIYYIGNVFRYDEPQFGRYREFTQAGVEILGGDEVYYDVELIELLEEFYDAIDLKNRRYKVNNVGIFRELANRAGLEDNDVDRLLHYLDKGMYNKAVELFIARGSYEEAKILETLAILKSESQDTM
ncbi:MAG: ATP phosphoribosyltransferase regulatory subunit, partial [Ignisphaera sp.]